MILRAQLRAVTIFAPSEAVEMWAAAGNQKPAFPSNSSLQVEVNRMCQRMKEE